MTRTRPTLIGRTLENPYTCDVCGGKRSTGKHAKCSRIRKQRMDAYWAENYKPEKS